MPQIKSAIKRVKTQNAAKERNASELSKLRTLLKLIVKKTSPSCI